MDNKGVATTRGQDTIQVLVHMKHGRKEILGLQSNKIVKRRKKLRRKLWKRRRKLRSKLMMRRKMRRRKMRRAVMRKEAEFKGGKHIRTARVLSCHFLTKNHLGTFVN